MAHRCIICLVFCGDWKREISLFESITMTKDKKGGGDEGVELCIHSDRPHKKNGPFFSFLRAHPHTHTKKKKESNALTIYRIRGRRRNEPITILCSFMALVEKVT